MKDRLKNRIRTYALLFLAFLLAFTPCLRVRAAEGQPLKKVRVGYLIYPGYQDGEGDDPKSGYGYEYLQQIAYYAGWEYEYVNGSFNELLEKLKKGEIDIMGDLSYTEERAQDISYAAEEQGREYYYLFVREDRTDMKATDPSTFQGARVGINKGSVQVELFQKWCEENQVECQVELYESSRERYADMNSGRLDAIVSTTVSESEILRYHWNSIIRIGYSPYYFAVSKKDPELYKELNDAITKILQSDWYYNEKVYLKYNGKTSAASSGLSEQDRKWLEKKSGMKVGYVENLLPYSAWSEEKQSMIGLLNEFIRHMETRYNTTFEPVRFRGYDEMIEALQQGEIDTAFPVYGSYWIAEKNQLLITDDLTSSYLMLIYSGAYDEETTSRIAVVEDNPLQQFAVQEHFPGAEIVVCRDDISMYSFMKKGLASMLDKDIHEALIAEDYANPEMNVRQFIHKHVVLVLLLSGVMLGLLLALLGYYIFAKRKNMRLSRDNSELSEKAYIDLATGLPNKNKCEEIMDSHRRLSKPTACFMLDLNDLKKVNDTLGHEMGDIMILNFAKLLRKVVPLRYFVGRFGGDEFIVVAEDISGREEAEQLMHEIREMIMRFNGTRGEVQINYACGYAFSEDFPGVSITDLLNEADMKMYEEKIRIKGQQGR